MRHTELLSIVYLSTSTDLFSTGQLSALVTSSRTNNLLTHLTGMLLYRDGRFLQALEGPEALVRGRMAVIAADRRHADVKILLEERIGQRRFPHWTMGYEPVLPTNSDEIPGFRKLFATSQHGEDREDTLPALRSLLSWFQERAQPDTAAPGVSR